MSQPITTDTIFNVIANVFFGVVASYAFYVVTDIKGKITLQRQDFHDKMEELRKALSGGILLAQDDIEILHKRADSNHEKIIDLQRNLDVAKDRIESLRQECHDNHRGDK